MDTDDSKVELGAIQGHRFVSFRYNGTYSPKRLGNTVVETLFPVAVLSRFPPKGKLGNIF